MFYSFVLKVFETHNEYRISEGCARMASSFGGNQRLGTKFGEEAGNIKK
jgi:hypothetical protein